jgi:hypothetical protein
MRSGWASGARLRDSPRRLRPGAALRSGWRCEHVRHDQSVGEHDVCRGKRRAATLPGDCECRREHGGEIWGLRWTGEVGISRRSFGRRADGSALDRSRAREKIETKKRGEPATGGFIAGVTC